MAKFLPRKVKVGFSFALGSQALKKIMGELKQQNKSFSKVWFKQQKITFSGFTWSAMMLNVRMLCVDVFLYSCW